MYPGIQVSRYILLLSEHGDKIGNCIKAGAARGLAKLEFNPANVKKN